VAFRKRAAEPVAPLIHVSLPGCGLQDPVRMDAFGSIDSLRWLMVGTIVKA
jgi:hypothetical protein